MRKLKNRSRRSHSRQSKRHSRQYRSKRHSRQSKRHSRQYRSRQYSRSKRSRSRQYSKRSRSRSRQYMRGGGTVGVATNSASVNVGGTNIAYNDGGDANASFKQIAGHIRGGNLEQNQINQTLGMSGGGKGMSGGKGMAGGSGTKMLNPGDAIVVPQFQNLPFTGAINVNSNMIKLYQNNAQAVVNATNDHLAGMPPSQ